MYPRIEKRVDVDRKGYMYILKVRITLNKKNEEVEEVILVKHLGMATPELLVNTYLPVHNRNSYEFIDVWLKAMMPNYIPNKETK